MSVQWYAQEISENPWPIAVACELLFRFMIKMMHAALQDIQVYRDYYAALQKLSPAASKVFECFREYPEKRLQTKDLMELTHLPRRTVIASINTCLKFSLVHKQGQGAGVRYEVQF